MPKLPPKNPLLAATTSGKGPLPKIGSSTSNTLTNKPSLPAVAAPSSSAKKNLFDDDDDDGTVVKNKAQVQVKPSPPPAQKPKTSLFDDDDDDGFLTKKQTQPKLA